MKINNLHSNTLGLWNGRDLSMLDGTVDVPPWRKIKYEMKDVKRKAGLSGEGCWRC